MQAQQSFAAWSNDFGCGHVLPTAVIVNGLCSTVEIELTRFVEQFVGIAYIKELVVVDLSCPSHRVENRTERLLETHDDGVAPLVELARTEYLLGPGLLLHNLHILGVTEKVQFGIGNQLDAVHALSCAESPRLFARNLEAIEHASTLRTLVGGSHHGTSVVDEQATQLDGAVEVRFPEVTVDLLPTCHFAPAAEDGRLTFSSS